MANELVEWFNAVDATYKADLRELNDRNWERFRAEMTAQFADFRSEVNAEFAKVRSEMKLEFAKVRSEMNVEFAKVRSEMKLEFASVRSEMDVKIAELRAELLKWMFVFWAGTVIPLAALMVSLTR